jgi:hypothetical protein
VWLRLPLSQLHLCFKSDFLYNRVHLKEIWITITKTRVCLTTMTTITLMTTIMIMTYDDEEYENGDYVSMRALQTQIE